MTIRLPDLPYAYDALMPHMSAETLKLHHGKHHRGYVDKLNTLLEDTKLAELALDEIAQESAGRADLEDLFNNAAQCWKWKAQVIAVLARPFGEDPEIVLEGARRTLGD